MYTRRTTGIEGWGGRSLAVVVWLCAACGDDGVAVTDGSSSGTSTGTTDEPIPTTGTPTSDPSTTTPTTGDTTSTTDTPTTTPVTVTDTDPTTGDTTTGTTDTTGTTTDTTGTTTDTTGDTDTDTGGVEVVGRSVSQTVNAGTVASSPNFRMVFTLGQPTSNQGTYQSANFRLQGGLIGANGNPP